MAFSFGNAGASAGNASSAGGVTQGPDLELIQTEALGFLSLAGEAKLRLTSQWSPAPAPNASLLAVASRKGLVAAAGPDSIVVATTESVRKAFQAPKNDDSDIRPFESQLKIPLPIRVCQLAFTADENYLILSAEQGGGLAVYETQALLQGATQATFEIPTNGEALRSLVPNPMPEKGELCAVVTAKGNLLVANMKERNFLSGSSGQILKDQVSCVAWSTKGKQLVAGLGDGSIKQMTPEGQIKAEIPRPPALDSNYFVSSIVWLENDVFLTIHVSSSEQPPQSRYHIITRQGQNFVFQKVTDPVDPFGSDKTPHHTALRLKDFPPNLQDLLILSSTATPDIGLLSRSKAALSSEFPVDKVTNVFTTTELADDSKRASLPMSESMDNTVPIGTALDLSSKETVYKPIPADEMEQSPGPLPGYWVLNDEGVLSVWWVIYTDSIRGGTTYPGLGAAAGNTSQPPANTQAPAQTAQSSVFGTPSTSAFGASTTPSTSAFGSTSATATAAPAFGGPSAIGGNKSVWGAQPTSTPSTTGGAAFGSSTFGSGASSSAPKFGAPAFGSPSFAKPAPSFGQSTGLGIRSSPWATAASGTSAFGQSGFPKPAGAAESSSPFGSTSTPSGSGSGGGFSSFANKGGFASLGGSADASGPSIFASGKQDASDISMDTDKATSFPPPASKPDTTSASPFGSTPFKLTSSFKPAADKDNEGEDESGKAKGGLFGSGFASAMNDAVAPPKPNPFASSATTTTSAAKSPAPNPFAADSAKANPFAAKATEPSKPGIFGDNSATNTKPNPFAAKATEPSKPGIFGDSSATNAKPNPFATGGSPFGSTITQPSKSLFGNDSTTPTSTPAPNKFGSLTSTAPTPGGLFSLPSKVSDSPGGGLFGTSKHSTEAPKIKVEEETPQKLKDVPEAPLPPESTSKASYPLGESSSSSATSTDSPDVKKPTSTAPEAVPLPPDFLSSKSKPSAKLPSLPKAPAKVNDAPLPPDPVTNRKLYEAKLPALPGVFAPTKAEKPKAKPIDDAPLPPDPVTQPKAYDVKLPPFPGPSSGVQKPLQQQQPQQKSALTQDKPPPTQREPLFKFPTNPPPVSDSDEDDEEDEEEDEGEDEEDEEGSEAGSEGSGVDVAKDLSPSVTGTNKTPGFTPSSSFDGLAGSYSTISRPEQPERRSLFGEVGRTAPRFPQPNPVSPRSPSPVRNALPTRVVREDSQRSFSAPGMASQILGGNRKSQQGLGASITGKSGPSVEALLEQQRRAKAKKEAEETQILIDEEDDAVQQILRTEPQPALELDEFVAHAGVAPPASDNIPAQVEAVYRDINSMIDTLGLNARSLKGFTQGHNIMKNTGRARSDLADGEDWTLVEMKSLGQIIDGDLGDALGEARVKDVEAKIAAIQDFQRELIRDRNKQSDLKKIIASRLDPDQALANRSLPLSAEQAAQQNDLRRDYARFARLLSEAEESLTVLKAKIVSANSANGKGGPVPTIEAIMRTITKMTTMVEKRSGDIDVLENQMRKLRFTSAGPGSREGSPFTSTPTKRLAQSSYFSPERSLRETTPQRGSMSRHSMSNSIASIGGGMFRTPPRKKLSGYGDTEKKAVKEKREKRALVLGKLRTSLEKNGVNVWPYDDIA